MVALSLFRVREGGGGPPIYKSMTNIIYIYIHIMNNHNNKSNNILYQNIYYIIYYINKYVFHSQGLETKDFCYDIPGHSECLKNPSLQGAVLHRFNPWTCENTCKVSGIPRVYGRLCVFIIYIYTLW